MSALLILLPDFAVIALGALISNRLRADTWRQIDWLCFYFFYPALLFAAASQRPVTLGAFASLGALGGGVVTLGFMLAWSIRRFGTDSPLDIAGALQNGWRFNTALGFVAMQALPGDAVSRFAIMVGVAIPLANVYAVILLTQGRQLRIRKIAMEVLLNPFLLASLGGALVALSGVALPSLVRSFLERLADAALPLVLLSIGAALHGSRWWPPTRFTLVLHSIKLLVMPAVVWTVASVTGTTGTTAATALVFAALPTATAAHVLASRYGADRQAVAVIITQSSVLGLITLPLWATVALTFTR